MEIGVVKLAHAVPLRGYSYSLISGAVSNYRPSDGVVTLVILINITTYYDDLGGWMQPQVDS